MSTYEISKSSLLSLKAEILRKQEEVNKEKLLNKAKAAQGIRKGSPLDLKNKGINERQQNDFDVDDDLLKKSRSALEAKAILYEKLSKSNTSREDDARFLVQFRKKNIKNDLPPDNSEEEDFDRYPESEEERHFSDEYEPPTNPDEEWVEYVDCLGRTRKCLRKDLSYIKERDSDLKSNMNSDGEVNDKKVEETPNITNTENSTPHFDENSELLSKDMRTELLRQKWEDEEEELRKKSDLHYQDILFDEARVHGVGYYGFSKDEKERARQQEALKKLREETQREQKKAEQLKEMRDRQLATRARAARNRKRARMGLPPEEEQDDDTNTKPEIPENDKTEDKKTAEELAKEKERELMRQKHIRPWDYGKEGIKEHVEYTQEDWVHKKRKDRDEEFAPPSSYNDSKHSLFFTTKKQETSKSKNKKSESSVDTSRPPPRINNPSKRKLNPYKTEENVDKRKSAKCDSTRIVDECVDFDDEQDELLKDYFAHSAQHENEESDEDVKRKGAEIAPPPTYDYYGPNDSKKRKKPVKKISIEASISAGLQFLRHQAEKKKTSTGHTEDMFLM